MFKKFPKNLIPLAVIIAGLAIAGAIIFVNIHKCAYKTEGKILSSQEAGKKVVDFINQKMLQGRATASLVDAAEKKENGLYKITISVQGKNIDTYATLDGKFLYPERFDMKQEITQNQEESPKTEKETCQDIKKADKPLMEAFVVSSCPYGLQAQRILAEIWKNIPSLMDNVKVRYIGSISDNKITSMHGDEEAQENLRQICVREEQPDKYWNYTSCYIKKGDTSGCLESAQIDIDKLDNCKTDSSRGLKYAEEDFDLQDKYKITGSPTLIINGQNLNTPQEPIEFVFGGRTAEAVKTLLCCGFNNSPDVCSKKLTTDSAVTSFSEEYSSGSASASGNCQ